MKENRSLQSKIGNNQRRQLQKTYHDMQDKETQKDQDPNTQTRHMEAQTETWWRQSLLLLFSNINFKLETMNHEQQETKYYQNNKRNQNSNKKYRNKAQ